jgi:hypothetical protein
MSFQALLSSATVGVTASDKGKISIYADVIELVPERLCQNHPN